MGFFYGKEWKIEGMQRLLDQVSENVGKRFSGMKVLMTNLRDFVRIVQKEQPILSLQEIRQFESNLNRLVYLSTHEDELLYFLEEGMNSLQRLIDMVKNGKLFGGGEAKNIA